MYTMEDYDKAQRQADGLAARAVSVLSMAIDDQARADKIRDAIGSVDFRELVDAVESAKKADRIFDDVITAALQSPQAKKES